LSMALAMPKANMNPPAGSCLSGVMI
jgi:hypothetical protein